MKPNIYPLDCVSYKPPNYGVAEHGVVIEVDVHRGRALVEWFDRTRTWVPTKYLQALQ